MDKTPNEAAVIAEIEAKHPRVARVKTPMGTLLFKPPERANFERFQDKLAKGGNESATARELCYTCRVHPSFEALDEVFNAFPGLPTKIVVGLQEMAGANFEFAIKKG